MTSQDAPPTAVESTQRGTKPMYSATSIGAIVPSPVDANPSMSRDGEPGIGDRPAGRLRHQRIRRGVVDASDVGQRDSGNGDSSTH